jgi:hypothetical protein
VGVVKLWGKERCWVPEEVLTSLGIDWDDHPDKGNILLSAQSNWHRVTGNTYLSCSLRKFAGT